MLDAIADTLPTVWPAFVLVAGLMLVGASLESDGVFAAIGARIERRAGGGTSMLAAMLALSAVVTAVLNLDSAALFVTPVMLHAARHRGVRVEPYLYGSLFMANAASLLFVGSNLTNLIVVSAQPAIGVRLAEAMWLPWIAAVAVTALCMLVLGRRQKSADDVESPRVDEGLPPLVVGASLAGTAAAVVVMLVCANPALPVLAIGLLVVVLRRRRVRVGVVVPVVLFVVATLAGAVGHLWSGPANAIADAGAVETAVIAAVASIVVNNLPAAALLSAQSMQHPHALLLGLNIGPNLAVTGSLSAYLWYISARNAGSAPSLRRVSHIGVFVAPLTLAAALLALRATT